jgi:hypothetical protein
VRSLNLTVLQDEFSVWRLAADAPLPPIEAGGLLSITRTDDELSIVSSSIVPAGVTAETGWRCLRVEGPLSFELTGVIGDLSAPLARAGIPIFVISTYNTDYVLVKATDLESACSALRDEGYTVSV